MGSRTLPRNALVKPRPRRARPARSATALAGVVAVDPARSVAGCSSRRCVVCWCATRRTSTGATCWSRCATRRGRRCWRRSALAAASHLLYSCFDLIGRRYTGHNLPHAHRDGRQLHQLRLQPVARLAGRRRRLPLPAVLAAGAGQRRHHAHRLDEHADQLAGLQAAGRLAVPGASAGAAAELEDGQPRPAVAGRRA